MRLAAIVVFLFALVPHAAAEDPPPAVILCPPSFVADGQIVVTRACEYTLRAPASPNVDQLCIGKPDGSVLSCVPAAPGADVKISVPAPALGEGHQDLVALAVDSALGVTSAPVQLGKIFDLRPPAVVVGSPQ